MPRFYRFYIPKVTKPTFFDLIPNIVWKTLRAVVAAYVLIVLVAAFFVYADTTNVLTRVAESIFPYPAAVVNRQVISLKRFRHEVAARQFYATKHNLPSGNKEIETYVMDQLVNRILYAQALQKAGVIVTKNDVDKRMDEFYQESGGETKLASFLRSNYGDDVTLTDLRTWTQESLMEAAIEHQLLVRATVRHILISVPEKATDKQVADAKSRAADVKKKIGSPDQFAAVAKEYSEDVASRDKGGVLGTTTRGNDQPVISDEFQQAIFTMPVGQISDPIRSSLGWHIVLVDSRDGAVNESMKEYTGELRSVAKIREYLPKK